ncbi:MAG: PilZ domain-containing protein [Myxococcota bacterium]
MDGESGPSRRSLERAVLKVDVERSETLTPGHYEAVNVSAGGICLRASAPEQVGGFVALKFPLFDSEISVYGEVIWCRPEAERNGYKLGLRFVVIGQRERETIERFVQENPEAE